MSAQGLPAHILPLFAPRPPIPYYHKTELKPAHTKTGIQQFVSCFEDEKPEKHADYVPPRIVKLKKRRTVIKKHKEKLREFSKDYHPKDLKSGTSDPYKTLFVARISFDTTDKKLKKEFETWGPIRRLKMIYDLKGRPRGYAFIEYESERDLKNAYKQADGKKIDGRRVLVDVERGRTVAGWLPRRFGGGRGPGRSSKEDLEMQALEDQERRQREKDEKEERRRKDKERRDRDRGDRDRDRDRDRGERGEDRDGDRDRDRDRAKKEKKKKDKERDDHSAEDEVREKKDKKEKKEKKKRDRDREKGSDDADREEKKRRKKDAVEADDI